MQSRKGGADLDLVPHYFTATRDRGKPHNNVLEGKMCIIWSILVSF